MGLGSLQSARFLELGYMMLTEGEPNEKVPRLSSTPTLPPDASGHEGAGHGSGGDSTGGDDLLLPADNMPAFPDRGGPPPLTTHHQHGGQGGSDADLCESPDGSNLSGGEGKAYGSDGGKSYGGSCSRKQREFIPDNRKDEQYWEKRRKNNEAARRSREKRRLHDMVLENRIVALEQENGRLRGELVMLKKRFGLPTDRPFTDGSEAAPPGLDGSLPERARRSPSPVAHHVKNSNNSTGVAVGPYSSPPPLLAVTGMLPMVLHQMNLTDAFPPQPSSAHRPYYMGGAPAAHEALRDSKLETGNGGVKLNHHQKPFDMIKREPEEDTFGGNKGDGCYSEEPLRDGGRGGGAHSSMYPPFDHVSPSGVTDLSATTAHFSGRNTFPPRHYDYAPQSWHQPHQQQQQQHQRSPISSHSSDEASDEPLQLTVHKRSSEEDSRDADSGREGEYGDHAYPGDRSSGDSNHGRYSNELGSSPQASLPVKLRHKHPLDVHGAFPPNLGNHSASSYTPPSHSFVSGLAQLSEIALAQASPLSLVKKEPLDWVGRGAGKDGHNHAGGTRTPTDLKHLDPKYLERRRRNNEAARKCRENRKNLTRMREAKSDYLESENNKLRTELESLQEEMKQLRELLDKKRLEQGLNKGSATAAQQAFSEQHQKQLEQLRQLEDEHRRLEREQRHQQQRLLQQQRQLQQQQEDGDEQNEFLDENDCAD